VFKISIETGIYVITILMIIAFLTPLVRFMYEIAEGSLGIRTYVTMEKDVFLLNMEISYNGSEALEKTVIELKLYKGNQMTINKTYNIGVLRKGDKKIISIEIPKSLYNFTTMEFQLRCVITNLYPITISYKQSLSR